MQKRKGIERLSVNEAPAYWKGFNAGQEHERKRCLEYFIMKIEELKNIPGVGEVTVAKIHQFIEEGLEKK